MACGRGPLARRRTPGPTPTCTAPRSPTSTNAIRRLQGERAEDCLDKGLEAMRHIRSLCDMPQLPHQLCPSGSTQGRQERARNVETSQRRILMRTTFSSVLVKSGFQCRRNTKCEDICRIVCRQDSENRSTKCRNEDTTLRAQQIECGRICNSEEENRCRSLKAMRRYAAR